MLTKGYGFRPERRCVTDVSQKVINNKKRRQMATVTVKAVLPVWQWKSDGTSFYRLRITFKRSKRYIKTNILARRDQLRKDGTVKDPGLRRRVEDLVRKTEDIVSALDADVLDTMTIDSVVDRISAAKGGRGFRLDFFAFALEAIASKGKSSGKGYVSALKALREYCGTDVLDISKVTSSMLRGWLVWLEEKYGKGARSVSAYTAAVRHLHNLARMKYNNEETGEVPIKNPFLYFRPPQQRQARHRAVDPAVIVRMIEMRGSLEGRERTGVDVFLISFALMGMNSPDLYSCLPPEGGIISYNRQKTRDRRSDRAEMRVRLEDAAMPLFREYAGLARAFLFSERYTTYEILGENVNDGLRKFARRIGYAGRITLYSARHTWATLAYRCGVDKGVINDCLCHVDREMKVTDLYIDKQWDVMWEANRRVLALFRWESLSHSD